jgi:hypothetical protein
MNAPAWMPANRTQCETLLDALLAAPVHHFDADLQNKLPEQHGVYAISVGEGDTTEFLWVGITHKSKRGLRRRIWEDHYKNPTSTSDLPIVIKRTQTEWNLNSAKQWIGGNCKVRWIEVKDERIRAVLEHYATALLQPVPVVRPAHNETQTLSS